eukprot:TRINITY_DN4363_c0_g2_i6.p1 TRINITY_DN4363_c0_g2~~TRINITY_DN4363_c0_g2_i6.p1  ORF type:complete len:182 (+),score=1.77 TRINITY_DN4363_c0_g2_i6:1776-2321(+)
MPSMLTRTLCFLCRLPARAGCFSYVPCVVDLCQTTSDGTTLLLPSVSPQSLNILFHTPVPPRSATYSCLYVSESNHSSLPFGCAPLCSDPAGTGTAALILTGRQLCYTLTTNQPDVTAGHIHMGVAGVDGPKIVDLTAGVADLTANPLKGCVTVTAGAASMLVGASASHYVNVHTVSIGTR